MVRDRLARLFNDFGYQTVGVPAFLIGDDFIVGFSSVDTTGQHIINLLDQPEMREKRSVPSGACVLASDAPCDDAASKQTPSSAGVETQLFGELNVDALGLPTFTLAIGLLDGFNPCAMWILLFLLSLLVHLQSRAKMVVVAGTFVTVSGIAYFAFMAAWLNVFLLIGFSRTLQIILGLVALVIGAMNVKEFYAFGQGLSLTIPDAAKPGIYARTRRVLQADNLSVALGGVVVLAVLVNIVELLCTAGFPAMYTHILTQQQFPWWTYYGYLGLYVMAYMFDDALMVTIAVVTLSHRRLQENEGRWLKLISGIVMAGLGGVLLGKPEWLFTLSLN